MAIKIDFKPIIDPSGMIKVELTLGYEIKDQKGRQSNKVHGFILADNNGYLLILQRSYDDRIIEIIRGNNSAVLKNNLNEDGSSWIGKEDVTAVKIVN